MKKLFLILTIIFLANMFIVSDSYAEINKKINANIRTKRVPAGTVINLKFLDPVSSATTKLGDQFDLMVTDNVKVNNDIVIPQGSVIRGSIEEVSPPKMLYKGGIVRLYFDHIVSPTGKQVPIYAGISGNQNLTYDGALSSNTTYKNAMDNTIDTTKNIVVKPTTRAWEKGEEMLNGSPKYVFAPATAIVTTPAAGLYFVGDSIADIFKKGKDITINQGESIKIQLLKPLDMPVY